MTLKEYNKLKNALGKLLEKAEQEAMEKGVNIASPDFQGLLLKLKKKILQGRGTTLQEFEELEKQIEERGGLESIDMDIALDLMAKMKQVQGIAESVKNLPDVVQDVGYKSEQGINNARNEQLAILQNAIKKVKKEFSDFRQQPTKEEIMTAHDWTDHTELIRDLNDFEQELSVAKKREQGLAGEIQRLEKEGKQREQEFNNSLEAVVDATLKLFPEEQYE